MIADISTLSNMTTGAASADFLQTKQGQELCAACNVGAEQSHANQIAQQGHQSEGRSI